MALSGLTACWCARRSGADAKPLRAQLSAASVTDVGCTANAERTVRCEFSSTAGNHRCAGDSKGSAEYVAVAARDYACGYGGVSGGECCTREARLCGQRGARAARADVAHWRVGVGVDVGRACAWYLMLSSASPIPRVGLSVVDCACGCCTRMRLGG